MESLLSAAKMATGIGEIAGDFLRRAADSPEYRFPPPFAGGVWVPRCPKCGGTGKVECTCSRWSDGDHGCRTCAGSGRMECNNCRGSGSGRMAPIRISVRSSRS